MENFNIKASNNSSTLDTWDDRFKLLFNLSPLGMALIDYNTGQFLEVNDSLLNSLQYEKEEFLNLKYFEITPSKYKELESEKIIELENTGTFSAYEKEYIRKDKSRFPIKINGFSFSYKNDRKAVWAIIEDITKTKEYESIYTDNKELLEYIAVEDSLQKSLDKITSFAERRSPKIKCSILILDEQKEHLYCASAPSLPKFYNDAINGVKIGEKVGSCGSAAYKKQRIIVENINTHENWQAYLELTNKANLHACWSEPFYSSNNEILGTFAIYHTSPSKPSEFELKLIETYSNLVSKALEKDKHTSQLRKNEKQLSQLFDNALVGLLYISKDRKLIKSNQRFASIMGYETPEELIDISMREFHLSQERYEEFGKVNFDSLVNRENFNIEYELRKKDGTSIWCELSGKTLDENKPADLSKGVLWTVHDISLRKKYEFQAKEKQVLLENILKTIPDMIWVKDLDGKYLLCNPEFEEFFGASECDIIGKTDYDFVDKELADFFRMHDKNAMKSNRLELNEEWVTYKGTNKKVLLDTSKKAIKNYNDEIVGILGIGHDVTTRKEKEDDLKHLNDLATSLTKSQEVLLSLFDKGDAVLFRWKNNKNWDVEYVSLSVFKLLEYESEDFILKTCDYDSLILEEDKEKVHKEVEYAIENNLDYFRHKPYRIVTKSGIEKWVMDYTVTEKDDKGNITHFIGYITDISEQIQSQEILYHQSKIASIGEMLGNISHQWRQPLSIISTISTGLKLKKELGMLEDNEFLESMDNINDNTQYLSETIDDFRNFFVSDTNSFDEVNLKDSLNKVFSLIKDSYNNSNIKIVCNIEEFIIDCNENLFIQALLNILNNARDAIKENLDISKDRYVFVDLFEQDNKYILSIKDNAMGIPSNVLAKIFEPYFTTKHKSKGTGIGLYMTNQIITKHLHGEILVENENYVYNDENQVGASFKLLLPIDFKSKDINE